MKRLAIALAVLIFVGISAFVGVSYYLSTQEDFLSEQIVAELQPYFLTPIQVDQVELSIWKRFPDISVALLQLQVAGSETSAAKKPNQVQAPLLQLERLYLEFNAFDFLKGDYELKEIRLEQGNLHIVDAENSSGNYSIFNPKHQSDSSTLELNLKKIQLHEVSVSYFSGKSFKTTAHVERLKLSLRANSDTITFAGKAQLTDALVWSETGYEVNEKRVNLSSYGRFSPNELSIVLESIQWGTMQLSGKIERRSDDQELMGDIQLSETSSTALMPLLPSSARKNLGQYQARASVSGSFAFKMLSEKLSYSADISLNKLEFLLPEQGFGLKKGDARLTVANKSPKEVTIQVEQFKGESAAGGTIGLNGVLSIQSALRFDVTLETNLTPEDLSGWIPSLDLNFEELSSNLHLKHPGWNTEKESKVNLAALEVDGAVQLLSYHLPDYQLKGNELTFQLNPGFISLPKSMVEFKGTPVQVDDFRLSNYREGFQGKTYELAGTIHSKKIDLTSLFPESDLSTDSSDNHPIRLPSNLLSRIEIRIDSLDYDKVRLTDLYLDAGTSYRKIHIHSMKANGFRGSMSGRGLVKQGPNLGMEGTISLQLDQVDLHEALYRSNNFGQTFITHSNLLGELSATIDYAFQASPEHPFNPIKPVVRATLNLHEGELFDFEPLVTLSRFIDLEELMHIRFSQIRTEIYYENETLQLPTTLIESSLSDFYLSGQYRESGEVDFRIDLYLSKLLSKKKRKLKASEQGSHAERHGRRHVYLRAKGPSDAVRIEFDPDGKEFFSATRPQAPPPLKQEEIMQEEAAGKEATKPVSIKDVFRRTEETPSDTTASKSKHRIEWE